MANLTKSMANPEAWRMAEKVVDCLIDHLTGYSIGSVSYGKKVSFGIGDHSGIIYKVTIEKVR